MEETWYVHPTYTSYAANRTGVIRNDETGAILARECGIGYYRVGINVGPSKQKKVLCHRFLYEAFHKKVLDRSVHVDHIDGNRLNNDIDNLQALSVQEHLAKTKATNPGMAKKANLRHSKEVVAHHIGTSVERTFHSVHAAARELDIDPSHIFMCLGGKVKTAKGYTFRYTGAHDRDLENEAWRPLKDVLPGKEVGKAMVSDKGRIMTTKGIKTFGQDRPDGYKKVCVKGSMYQVHVLVCMAFCGVRPSPDHTVDHIDRRRDNNNAINLRWATRSQQARNTGARDTIDKAA